MDKSEAFSLLFFDTFFSNLVLSNKVEFINKVMISFDFDKTIIILISVIGFIVSVAANYLFGSVLLKIYLSLQTDPLSRSNYLLLQKTFERFGNYLAIFNFLPIIGNFLPMLAGFVKHNFYYFLIFSSISRIIFYIFIWQ